MTLIIIIPGIFGGGRVWMGIAGKRVMQSERVAALEEEVTYYQTRVKELERELQGFNSTQELGMMFGSP